VSKEERVLASTDNILLRDYLDNWDKKHPTEERRRRVAEWMEGMELD